MAALCAIFVTISLSESEFLTMSLLLRFASSWSMLKAAPCITVSLR